MSISDAVAHRPNQIVLILLCLALYLPGLTSIPPVDRDEARFAQSTRQMVEGGDFVRPQFQDEDRFRKPIGIYWLQASSLYLTGAEHTQIWAYRLPSTIAGVGAVLLTYHFATMWFAPPIALTGAALLATSTLLIVESHLATTDATLLLLIVLAQGCLGVLYVHARRGRVGPFAYALGFWIAQAFAILIKGPVAPLISGLTLVTLNLMEGRALSRPGWWRQGERKTAATEVGPPNLGWQWGVPLLLAIVLPWTIAIARDTDGAFFTQWWRSDLLPKLIGGHESHGAPPGTYLIMLAATFWPGSIALVPVITRARRRNWRASERFLLAWLVPAWLVFEIVPTKLPHYVLPLFPPLALLCARAALSAGRGGRSAATPYASRGSRWWRLSLIMWATLGLSATAALILVPPSLGGAMSGAPVVGAMVLGSAVLAAAGWACTNQWRAALGVACAASAVLSVTAFGVVLPRAQSLWLSQRAAAAAGGRLLAAAGYTEPSLVFLAGRDLRMSEPQELVRFLRERRDALALIPDSARTQFDAAATAAGVATRVVWSGDGFNYSKGQRTRLFLLERASADRVAEMADAAAADHQAFVAR